MDTKFKFLIEVKDLSDKKYYFRTTAIDENYAVSAVAAILSGIPNHSSDRFMKVYSDTDCQCGEFYIDRTKIIGYRIVLDLTAAV